MSNPYRIEGPALISFSGGRTSGYMLHEIVQAHGGTLPDNIHVLFANTGKEREETLRFVHDCSTHWNVHVRWVEWRDTDRGFDEVGLNSAAQSGEPFNALIAKKKITPNWQMRFCTQYLKVQAMTDFAASLGLAPGSYQEVIGLRYDEGMRIFKMLERNDKYGRKCIAPLSRAHVTEPMILDWWSQQPFNLNLKPGEGNCDLCFLKGRSLRKQIIREQPSRADWWADAEQSVGGWFDKRDSYAGLKNEVAAQPDFFEVPDAQDYDVECGLICQP